MTGSAHGTNGWSEQRAERGRFSSRRKSEAVLRLLHGEELDALSRELVVTGATLSQWRERFLAAGQALTGPAIIEQLDATTLIFPGDRGVVDAWGNLIVTLAPGNES